MLLRLAILFNIYPSEYDIDLMSLYVMCFFSLEVSRHIKASIVAKAYRAAELSRVVNHNTCSTAH